MAAGPGRVRTAALLSIVVVAWGLNYLFVRRGLDFAAPLWLAFLRAGIGALVAGAILGATGLPRLARRDQLAAAALGLLNTTLFFGLWFVAAQSIPPGEAAVVVYTFPLWVALLSGPVLGRGLRAPAAGAIGAGFLGIVLISRPWAGAGLSLPPVPIAELLAGSLSWALGTVLIQRRFGVGSAGAVNFFQLLGGAAGLLVAALVVEGAAAPALSLPLVGIAIWLGVVGTAAAYSIWFWLLERTPAAVLSTKVFLVPVVALVASAILLGERIDSVQAVGVALVAVAIVVVGQSAAAPVGSRRP